MEMFPTCQVCHCSFTLRGPSPFLLPCLHDVCEKCLTFTAGGIITCSTCKSDVNLSETQVQKDTVTESQVLHLTIKKRSNDLLCTHEEDGNQAVCWCQDCEEMLCESCQKMHQSFKALNGHTTRKLTDINENTLQQERHCMVHKSFPLDTWDKTCRLLLCSRCSRTHHEGHELEDIEHAVKSQKQRLKSRETQMKAQVELFSDMCSYKEHVTHVNANLRSEIVRTFSTLRAELDSKETRLLVTLDELTESLLDDISRAMNFSETIQHNCKATEEYIGKCLKFAPNHEIVYFDDRTAGVALGCISGTSLDKLDLKVPVFNNDGFSELVELINCFSDVAKEMVSDHSGPSTHKVGTQSGASKEVKEVVKEVQAASPVEDVKSEVKPQPQAEPVNNVAALGKEIKVPQNDIGTKNSEQTKVSRKNDTNDEKSNDALPLTKEKGKAEELVSSKKKKVPVHNKYKQESVLSIIKPSPTRHRRKRSTKAVRTQSEASKEVGQEVQAASLVEDVKCEVKPQPKAEPVKNMAALGKENKGPQNDIGNTNSEQTKVNGKIDTNDEKSNDALLLTTEESNPEDRVNSRKKNLQVHNYKYKQESVLTIRKTSPTRHRPKRHTKAMSEGGRQGGGGGSMRPSGSQQRIRGNVRVIKMVSIQLDVKLHKAENAWRTKTKKDTSTDDPETMTIDLYRKVLSILNKLTPQKFQILIKQVQGLVIDTETRLKGVTDIIFEKAISEPIFSEAYANMCRYLLTLKVPSDTKQGESVNFRVILLTRCQREFEKDKDTQLDLDRRKKDIEEAKDPKKVAEMKEELNQSATNARRRSVGNIRFLGELFKLKMLTETIMHDCVFKLLRSRDEENLECLCQLLTIIGKELESDKAKPRMDQYFQQMKKIVAEKKASSRCRFMLQDVIDLRDSNWKPRRDDNTPKTIDQIHKEAKREAVEQKMLTALHMSRQPSQPQHHQSRHNKPARGRPGGQAGGSMEVGWNTVSGKAIRNIDRNIDVSKLRIEKRAEETILRLPLLLLAATVVMMVSMLVSMMVSMASISLV